MAVTATTVSDRAESRAATTSSTAARGNDVALHRRRRRHLVWNPGDGSDTVEGQAGTDTMVFNGANANENIDISANGCRVRLFRDVGNVTMDLNGVEGINVNALGGADTITVNDLTGTDLTSVNSTWPPSGQRRGDGRPTPSSSTAPAGMTWSPSAAIRAASPCLASPPR